MGDASIIAKLLANGHVQYGWSGNGGYFSMEGIFSRIQFIMFQYYKQLLMIVTNCFWGVRGSSLGSCSQSVQKDFSQYTVIPQRLQI